MVMTEVSKRWDALPEKERKPYHDKNAKDQKRYEKQWDELNKKNYFIMDDGKKSSEVEPKKKRVKREKNLEPQEAEEPEEKPRKMKGAKKQ